jgi:hypothetical protein
MAYFAVESQKPTLGKHILPIYTAAKSLNL